MSEYWFEEIANNDLLRLEGPQGTFALRSGANAGPILLEAVTDRADNNVTNGIQDPVSSLLIVTANAEVESSNPLAISTTTIDDATLATPYSFILQATGGNAPYTWSASGLPPGLTLSSSGLISGVPSANVTGTYKFVATLTDAIGKKVQQNMTIVVGGTPTYTPLNITLSGCSSDLTTSCALPDATSGLPYLYALSATGGDDTKSVTWSVQPSNWLSMSSTAGNAGVLSGTPTSPTASVTGVACSKYSYVVTATRGTYTSTRVVTVNVTSCPAIVTPPVTTTP